MAGPTMPSTLRCHWRWLNQPSALASSASAANSGSSTVTNTASNWLKKPSPSAAPRLARAGKQAPQPIAETMLPSAPALSATRVMTLILSSSIAAASALDGGRIARVLGRRGQLLHVGLGIVEGHDGLALLVAHVDLAHAVDLRDRLLHRDRTRRAGHARHVQRHGLRRCLDTGRAGHGEGRDQDQLLHGALLVSRTAEGHRGRPARSAPARPRTRRRPCRWTAPGGSRTPRPACTAAPVDRCDATRNTWRQAQR